MHAVSHMRAVEDYRLFPRLSAEACEVWRGYGEAMEVPGGTTVLREGDWFYPFLIVLGGELQVSKRLGQQNVVLAHHHPGDFCGEVTLLAGAPCPATAVTLSDARLLVIPGEVFRSLVAKSLPEATEVVQALAVRSAEIGAIGRQQEKLASIGRIAAGLAHELNNPAASIVRGAATLKQEILRNLERSLQVSGFSQSDRALLTSLFEQRRGDRSADDLQIADDVDDLAAWLGALHVRNAALYAANLVEYGLRKPELEAALSALDGSLNEALEWLGNTTILLSAAEMVDHGSRRISEIVSRMKHYTHLDQSPVIDVDLHKEIDATLEMLAQRLRNVEVRRSYCTRLPTVPVLATELNQVWTNLIENALDAMPNGGSLHIETDCDDTFVQVAFTDSGVGIAPEIQPCIFEPFFTTKDVGQGFGLGLDYVYRTVVRRHSGEIRFASVPGETRFCVHLPVTGNLSTAHA